MGSTSPPRGCGNILSDYFFLCDTEASWGIVLESLATAGVIATVILLMVFFILICKVQDNSKRSLLPVQFVFLMGTLGIFGLTFAFIIKLNETTAPTRFFLFGVLFALCFSCLLAHAFNLIKLVRGRTPLTGLVLLAITIGLTTMQVVIAIEYVVINMAKLKEPNENLNAIREDFVSLLIYVLFLMALLFVVVMFAFCGPYRRWKRHGAHILVTILFSIAIWIVWIVMLMSGNPNLGKRPEWDDPVLSIALVVNGWVFLMMYTVPELCFLTSPRKPGDYPPDNSFCQPKLMKKSYGVENQAFSQDANSTQAPEENGDRSYVPYSTHFQLQTLEAQQDFSIPRPKARPSPYQDYAGGKGV